MQGRNALKIVWDDGPNATYDSVAYRATLEEAARKPGKVVRNDGDFAAAAASAAKRITAEYYLSASRARVDGTTGGERSHRAGKCEVWGCFQSPQAARDLVAKRLGMPVENVTVHVTLLGGGFGRKSKPDYGIEAAVLSKAMDGKPVKVVWTRDDDLHNDYFHTVSVEHLEAGLDAQGLPVAWLHRSVAPTIVSTFDASAGRKPTGNSAWASSTCRSPSPISASKLPKRSRIAHRLLPLGVEHSARVRGAIVRCRAGCRGRARPRRTTCST